MTWRGTAAWACGVALWSGSLGAAPVSRAAREVPDHTWRSGRIASETELAIVGSRRSVAPGGRIDFEIGSDRELALKAELFRLGFYGGAGARRIASVPLEVGARCSVKSEAPCVAKRRALVLLRRDAPEGLYLLKVTRADGMKQVASFTVIPER